MTTIEPIQLDWMSAPEFSPPERQTELMTTNTTSTQDLSPEAEASQSEFKLSSLDFIETTSSQNEITTGLSFETTVAVEIAQSFELTESQSEAPVESIPAVLCDQRLLEEIASIPNRMAFKIGDVADILGIKQYVLRYWETEFEVLKPKKAANNQRAYSRRDVENALLIRKLLHRDRFSIEGARSAMKSLKSYVRKEKDQTKDLVQVKSALHSSQDQMSELLISVRQLRALFK